MKNNLYQRNTQTAIGTLALIVAILCLNTTSAISQSTFQIGRKEYTIPDFSNHTLDGKHKLPSHYLLLSPVVQPESPLEIRCYFMAGLTQSLVRLKVEKRKLVADYFFYMVATKEFSERYPSAKIHTNDLGQRFMVMHKSANVSGLADSLLGQLLRNGFYGFQNYNQLADSVKQENVKINQFQGLDGMGPVWFEIYTPEGHREFTMVPDIERLNPQVDRMKKRIEVVDFFHSLYEKSGLPLPSW